MLGRSGFTITETLVAVMILAIGLLGLVTTAGVVTRMIGQGQRFTQVSVLANERVEILRAQSCPATGAGSETRGAYVVSWEVTSGPGIRSRSIRVSVTSPAGRGTRVDTVQTVQMCS
jgi:prepilin-type N-terminal cleavage/methylation domain-containing protein